MVIELVFVHRDDLPSLPGAALSYTRRFGPGSPYDGGVAPHRVGPNRSHIHIMGRTSLLPAVAILLTGLTLGTTGCGDDKADIKAVATTTEKATTTTEPEDDPTETTLAEDTGDTGESPFEEVDLGDELNPIEGYTYASLPTAAQEALISSFAADPSVTELVAAVGTTTVSDGTDTALLIFLGLNRELDATETQQFVDGVTAGGTNLEQGEVAGQTGWAYVSADGTQGFITIRQDTVVIGQSDSVDHLSAVIQGLFVANPDL